VLEQPDELGRRAGRHRRNARLHDGERLRIADGRVRDPPFDGRELCGRRCGSVGAIDRRRDEGGFVNHLVTIPVLCWVATDSVHRKSVPVATLNNVSLDIAVVLGSTVMPVHQVLRLGRGAIIELDTRENDAVRILVNNHPVAEGAVVVSGSRIGVEVRRMLPRSPEYR
jgi:flagellar motor switch protein FliN